MFDNIVHRFIDYQRMSEKIVMDKLYSENLKLGNRINDLNGENNFYKIQINNFNKLTNSINKDLYKLGINFQNKQIVEDSVKIGPLFIISNKIKLKNLQLKIGNSIRNTEKFKKNLEGSLPFITKQIESLEEEVSCLLTKYLQTKQQNELLKDINYAEIISQIYDQFKEQLKNCRNQDLINANQLQLKKKEAFKKLQIVKKEEKQKNRILQELITSNQTLQSELKKLKSQNPQSIEQNLMRAKQSKQLQDLQNKQKQLLGEISALSKQLQEQYAVNKDFKQKISDKKYQQNKEIKVLEQEVLKCREQVRQFKQKYRKIRVSGLGRYKNIEKSMA